jgi:transcription elongation factor
MFIYRQKVRISGGFYKGYYGIVKSINRISYYVDIYLNDRFEELGDENILGLKHRKNMLTSDDIYFWNLKDYKGSNQVFVEKLDKVLDDES